MYNGSGSFNELMHDISAFLYKLKISPSTNILEESFAKLAGISTKVSDCLYATDPFDTQIIITMNGLTPEDRKYFSHFLSKNGITEDTYTSYQRHNTTIYFLEASKFHVHIFPLFKDYIKSLVDKKDPEIDRYRAESVNNEDKALYDSLVDLLAFLPSLQKAAPEIMTPEIIHQFTTALSYLEQNRHLVINVLPETAQILEQAQDFFDFEDKLREMKDKTLSQTYEDKIEKYGDVLFTAPGISNVSFFKLAKERVDADQDNTPTSSPTLR